MDVLTVYHGSKEAVESPEIRIARFNNDFYFGFYCTIIEDQAIKWACRFSGAGVMNEYAYAPDDSLRVLRFPEMTEEWLDFVVACRRGVPHDYDIVEGPMADDQIYNYVEDFAAEKISRAAFWELVKFKHPTHQISFHTARALMTLRFLRSYEVRDEER